jgi:hypothetical protein
MESHQALVAHNATTEDLERSVNELLCPKAFSVNAHEKREEIFQELQRLYQIEQFNLTKKPNSQWRDELLTRNRQNALVTRPIFARGGTKKLDLTTAAEEEETAMIAIPSSSLQIQADNADADEEDETAIIALPSSSLQIQADNADADEEDETAMIAIPSSSLQSQADNADADEEDETAIIALPSSSLQIQADNADEEEKLYFLEEEPQKAKILSSAQQESFLVALNCTVTTTISNIFAANSRVKELAKQLVDDPRFINCIKQRVGSIGLYLNRSGKFEKSIHLVVYGHVTNCIHVVIQRKSTSINPSLIWYKTNKRQRLR